MLLLIAAAWIAIVMIVLAACRAAARSDANSGQAGREAQGGVGALMLPGLTVWDAQDPERVRSTAAALLARPESPSPRRTVAPLRIARHDRRAARLETCATGAVHSAPERS